MVEFTTGDVCKGVACIFEVKVKGNSLDKNGNIRSSHWY